MTPEQFLQTYAVGALAMLIAADGIAYMLRGILPGIKPLPVTRFFIRLIRRLVGGTFISAGTAIRGGGKKKR